MSKASLWAFPFAAAGRRGLSTLTYEGSSNISRPPSLAPTKKKQNKKRKQVKVAQTQEELCHVFSLPCNSKNFVRTKQGKNGEKVWPISHDLATNNIKKYVSNQKRKKKGQERQIKSKEMHTCRQRQSSPGRGGRGCLWMSFWPGCP